MESKLTMIHTCQYCRKYYKRKDFAIKHEKYCHKNPNNKHACLVLCKYLKKEKTESEFCIHTGCYDSYPKTVFTCTKTGQEMYSYVAERMNIESRFGEDLGIRMPLECDDYENEMNIF